MSRFIAIKTVNPADLRQVESNRTARGDGPKQRISPEATQTRSPLFDFGLPLYTVSAYFHQISIPTGVDIPSQASAWYPLRKQALPSDCMFIGAHIDLMACDVDGAGGGGATSPAAWGTSTGTGAWMVAGNYPNLDLNTWKGQSAHLPGVEIQSAGTRPADSLISPENPVEYALAEAFPAGKWSDTQPARNNKTYSHLPAGVRFRENDSFVISLVVGRDVVHNLGAAKTLVGRGYVRCFFASAEALTRWGG